MYLVTGGAGFIGSNFLHDLESKNIPAVCLDALTYAGDLGNLEGLRNTKFVHGDIQNQKLVLDLLNSYKPTCVVHFAAETHVDRSIQDPELFIKTNILGTFKLLECCLKFYQDNSNFKFLHVSTDEVFGSLDPDLTPFTESSPYRPNNPYSASKAASDHLVRAFFVTYRLPVNTVHASNIYGPRQNEEKLIPSMTLKALSEQPLTIYGNGQNRRDWLHVKDFSKAVEILIREGKIGDSYNLGGAGEKTNSEVVEKICKILDSLKPRKSGKSYSDLVTHIADRPGHDFRYALNSSKMNSEFLWNPSIDFEQGLFDVVSWHLSNKS